MAEVDTPIEVSANPVPATLAAALRLLLVVLGAVPLMMQFVSAHDMIGLIRYFQSDQGMAVLLAGGALGAMVWGVIRTHLTRLKLITAAKAAPNSVARVK